MRLNNVSKMPFDQLVELKEELDSVIAEKVRAERGKLTQRIAELDAMTAPANGQKVRTHSAKYRDPKTGLEWSGQGRRPIWFAAALKAGKKPDSFLIRH